MAEKIKRGDTRPGVTVTCTNGDVPADLTVADSARLIGSVDGIVVVDRAVTGNADGEIVIDRWLPEETAQAGLMFLEVEVVWADGSIQTFPTDGYLSVQIVPDLG